MAHNVDSLTQAPISQKPEAARRSSCARVRQPRHQKQIHPVKMDRPAEVLRRSSVETPQALTSCAHLYAFAPLGYCTFDENGLITRANMIVGTTHNLGPMNMSVNQAARMLIRDGHVDEGILNQIEMAVRAYDP